MIDWLIDPLLDWLIDWLIDRLIDWLIFRHLSGGIPVGERTLRQYQPVRRSEVPLLTGLLHSYSGFLQVRVSGESRGNEREMRGDQSVRRRQQQRRLLPGNVHFGVRQLPLYVITHWLTVLCSETKNQNLHGILTFFWHVFFVIRRLPQRILLYRWEMRRRWWMCLQSLLTGLVQESGRHLSVHLSCRYFSEDFSPQWMFFITKKIFHWIFLFHWSTETISHHYSVLRTLYSVLCTVNNESSYSTDRLKPFHTTTPYSLLRTPYSVFCTVYCE